MGKDARLAGHMDPEAVQVGPTIIQRKPEGAGPVRGPVEQYFVNAVIERCFAHTAFRLCQRGNQFRLVLFEQSRIDRRRRFFVGGHAAPRSAARGSGALNKSGRSLSRSTPVTFSTSIKRENGTRSHCCTAPRVSPRSRARRALLPHAAIASVSP